MTHKPTEINPIDVLLSCADCAVRRDQVPRLERPLPRHGFADHLPREGRSVQAVPGFSRQGFVHLVRRGQEVGEGRTCAVLAVARLVPHDHRLGVFQVRESEVQECPAFFFPTLDYGYEDDRFSVSAHIVTILSSGPRFFLELCSLLLGGVESTQYVSSVVRCVGSF